MWELRHKLGTYDAAYELTESAALIASEMTANPVNASVPV
jgi:hypothetical protein